LDSCREEVSPRTRIALDEEVIFLRLSDKFVFIWRERLDVIGPQSRDRCEVPHWVTKSGGESHDVKRAESCPMAPPPKDPSDLGPGNALVRVYLVKEKEAWACGHRLTKAEHTLPRGISHLAVKHLGRQEKNVRRLTDEFVARKGERTFGDVRCPCPSQRIKTMTSGGAVGVAPDQVHFAGG
jgi:hypothetical protein